MAEVRGGGSAVRSGGARGSDGADDAAADDAEDEMAAEAQACARARAAAAETACDLTSPAALAAQLLEQCASDASSTHVVGSAIVESSAVSAHVRRQRHRHHAYSSGSPSHPPVCLTWQPIDCPSLSTEHSPGNASRVSHPLPQPLCQGPTRFDATLLPTAFPWLQAASSSLQLAFLRREQRPPERFHALLGSLGCASSSASLRGSLKALKALCHAIDARIVEGSGAIVSVRGGGGGGGDDKVGGAGVGVSGGSLSHGSTERQLHRSLLFTAYTSVDSLARSGHDDCGHNESGGDGDGGSGAGGRGGDDDGDKGRAAGALQEVREAFARYRLLWAGEASGFVSSEDVICHAPRVASLLRLADPTAAFPELAPFFLDRLGLPRATPVECMSALDETTHLLSGNSAAPRGGAALLPKHAAEVMVELEATVAVMCGADTEASPIAASALVATSTFGACLDEALPVECVRLLAAALPSSRPASTQALDVVAPTVEAPLLYMPPRPPPPSAVAAAASSAIVPAPAAYGRAGEDALGTALGAGELSAVARLFSDVIAFESGALEQAPQVGGRFRRHTTGASAPNAALGFSPTPHAFGSPPDSAASRVAAGQEATRPRRGLKPLALHPPLCAPPSASPRLRSKQPFADGFGRRRCSSTLHAQMI